MKHFVRPKKLRGGVVILVSLMMSLVLFAFVALAVDLTQVYSVQKQMQNAADATALYGAGYLFPPASSGGPNFSQAQAQALTYVSKNKVDGVTLSNATVVTGYWDITQTKPGVRTITSPDVIGPNDAAAVEVTITKSSGINGGPLAFYFAPIFGVSATNVTVKSVAIVGSPLKVSTGGLFPLAIASSQLSSLWDLNTNQPVGGGTPSTIAFTSSNLGWSSFNTNKNDVPTVQNFITNGSPISYSIGDQIWIQPGVKAAIYKDVPLNTDILVAIVNSTGSKGLQPILGFVSIHIISSNQGKKTITGHINASYQSAGGGTIQGMNYGVYTSPRLVY